MRKYPENESEFKELEELNAENWMIECLKKNPDYVWWGNYEDYMCHDGSGWDSRCEVDSIKEGLWGLDEYNELVNFYFEVYRKSEECKFCDQSGYNKETKQISDDWYDFANTGKKWCYDITQDEVDALWDNHRLHIDFKEKPTAEEVNKWARKGFGHDAINHWICVEQRAKRLGVWGYCEHCEGKGRIYIEPKAKLGLQLWILHPRKGCSRGIYIKDVKQEELSTVIAHLKEAQNRNNERFSKL